MNYVDKIIIAISIVLFFFCGFMFGKYYNLKKLDKLTVYQVNWNTKNFHWSMRDENGKVQFYSYQDIQKILKEL